MWADIANYVLKLNPHGCLPRTVLVHVYDLPLPLLPSLSLQDPFQVWDESSTSRSLFSWARERHVFLFEKMVIFSKKIEASIQKREKKLDNYL